MNTLESPLEALAFNYLSYGFLTAVNNVWTWVAVLTAAVSFWRIKTLSLSVPSTPQRPKFPNGPSNLPTPTPTPPRGIVLSPSPPVERLPDEPASTPAKAAATSFSAWERESLTKGKFTAYFDGGDESDGNVGRIENIYDREGGGDDDESNGDGDVLALGNEWYESWERVMQMKTGDAGWYRCQDSTAINGNVVRLWGGGCRRRSATALVAVGRVVSTW